MGKVVIIALLIAAVSFTVLTLAQKDKREDSAENTGRSMAKIQAKSLSNEALNYSIKKLYDGSLNFVNGEASLSFSNFNVLEGAIDSLYYKESITGDSIFVTTYVSYPSGNDTVQKSASAVVNYVPANITAAVSANGDIIIKGNAAVVGDVDANCDPPLNFEEIFGVSKAYVESLATNLYIDPANNISPCTDITWVKFSDPSNSFKVTTTGWSGSGLTVIDGDADFSGGTFYGILWVTGELRITGNLTVEGALYVEGGTEISATVISGSPVIEFSVEAVSDFLSSVTFPTEMQFNFVSIFYD
ncbi:MAG: hypothetical protein K9N09_06455 [Candidatus Cloacimonetes bacterium]|nr:hypothetical protein [Candidatus Cloacimonadota bacterium]MCF7813648.1 hypothetical protein [Candidatus Cloacimonadota bacterium]MCF7868327.1 hypothetical protein [Candidatus Cloacimonadota bacterium]MCF7883801.1 hypothetical protein [Candidatus Cloacimonadota bacterium]